MRLVQVLRPSYFEPVEKELEKIFYQIVFEPLVGILKETTAQLTGKHTLQNDLSEALRAALRAGRVQYADGKFSGRFSVSIATALRQIGAVFSKREGIYRLEPSRLPPWVHSETAVYQTRAKTAHKEIETTLNHIEASLDQAVDRQQISGMKMVDKVDAGFVTIAKRLQVSPRLPLWAKERLAKEYNGNMKLWIQKFSARSIVELRESVEKNAIQGYRFDTLIDAIQERYGVMKSKAKFLARQETSLFMSKFHQMRFREAGVETYQWSTSHDERVRDQHKDLDKKVFSFDSPPIVDKVSGRRGNPGEDFNCRCIAIPILKGALKAAEQIAA